MACSSQSAAGYSLPPLTAAALIIVHGRLTIDGWLTFHGSDGWLTFHGSDGWLTFHGSDGWLTNDSDI